MCKIKRFMERLRASRLAATSTSAREPPEKMNRLQDQSADREAIAIQAGGDVNIGLSYTETKAVALDVFRANFYQLAGLAREVATTRAEEITEAFLTKLESENPDGFRQANDPGFQHALYTVQKEHARTGDRDLGGLLVDLLVDRTKQQQRDFLQIVLDESLSTAPKLTQAQLASLAAVFFLRYTQNHSLGNHELLADNLDRFLAPFVGDVTASTASFQRLEFSGCGAIAVTQMLLEEILEQRYRGLFLKGFDASEIDEKALAIGNDPRVFITCLNDPTKIQVNALNQEGLERKLDSLAFGIEDKAKVVSLFNHNPMTSDEVRDKCVQIRGYMKIVFDFWSNSPAKNFTLTSVGIAIGHANVKRISGEFADLSIWIN